MKSLFQKRWRISALDKAENLIASFSPAERVVFIVAGAVMAFSVLWLLVEINNAFMTDIPAQGGTIVEGETGSPRFVNPILATSDADRDLSALVYSGLMREMPDGSLVPDLASGYTVSKDGLTYTFTLRSTATFQDGTPVTADDVAFTVEKAQDPAIKGPEYANWSGVTAKVIDTKTIAFTLKQPYSFFIDNTTLGILPKHIWQNVSDDNFAFSEVNTMPIGSGPYEITSVSHDGSGVPTEYDLSAFNHFTLGVPHIAHIDFKIYPDDATALAALTSGAINAYAGIEPGDMPINVPNTTFIETPYARIFALFFNQNQNALFADKSVRVALDLSAPKQDIVDTVLHGYGNTLTGPLPTDVNTGTTTDGQGLAAAETILSADGWKESSSTGALIKTSKKATSTIAFSISTGNVPDLVATANMLRNSWETLGADVDVKVFDQNDLVTDAIEPRTYDTLLLGMVLGDHPDLYAFWDSSQRNYPGLNVAEYANVKVDKVLEDARTATDEGTITSDIMKFNSSVASDTPAVFLYTPDFIYAVPSDLKNLSLGEITTPSDRFDTVYEWYTDTEKVWSIFSNNNQNNN